MNLGLYHHSTELFYTCEIGHYSQALATNLLVVDLDHIVDEGMDKLYFYHLVFWVGHE